MSGLELGNAASTSSGGAIIVTSGGAIDSDLIIDPEPIQEEAEVMPVLAEAKMFMASVDVSPVITGRGSKDDPFVLYTAEQLESSEK